MKRSRLRGRSIFYLKISHPQGTEDFSVQAADLAGSVIQSQDLGVTVAVAIIGHLPSAKSDYCGLLGKTPSKLMCRQKNGRNTKTETTSSSTVCTNFDLPAGQRSVCRSFRVQVCGNPAVLQGELALQSCQIQKDGRDKLGLVQDPLPTLKLETQRGREAGSHEEEEVKKRQRDIKEEGRKREKSRKPEK